MRVFSRLVKAASGLMTSPEQRAEQAARNMGLSIRAGSEYQNAWDACVSEGLAIVERDGFAGFERSYMEAFTSKALLPHLRHVYAALEGCPGTLIDASKHTPDHAEAVLPAFRIAWEKAGRSPVASAFFGSLLFHTGFCYRGTSWASEVSEEGWSMLAHYSDEAHDVFLQCAEQAERQPYWHRALFEISLSDGSDEEQKADRFRAALEFDPLDFNIYESRAHQLTPRWGGSYQQIEELARLALSHSERTHGAMLYARIYNSIVDMEFLPDTKVDWPLLKRGFEDWRRLHDNQHAANRAALLGLLFEDADMLGRVAGTWLREYQLDAWPDAELAVAALTRVASLRPSAIATTSRQAPREPARTTSSVNPVSSVPAIPRNANPARTSGGGFGRRKTPPDGSAGSQS